jgi:hypothetical protein
MHLQDASADVLTIIDSCYAPTIGPERSGSPALNHAHGNHRNASRCFEIIAATRGHRLGSTEPSFTRALIETLIELQDESVRPFDTSRLHRRVMDHMRPFAKIPPLYDRKNFMNTRHICLAPLPKTAP